MWPFLAIIFCWSCQSRYGPLAVASCQSPLEKQADMDSSRPLGESTPGLGGGHPPRFGTSGQVASARGRFEDVRLARLEARISRIRAGWLQQRRQRAAACESAVEAQALDEEEGLLGMLQWRAMGGPRYRTSYFGLGVEYDRRFTVRGTRRQVEIDSEAARDALRARGMVESSSSDGPPPPSPTLSAVSSSSAAVPKPFL